MFTILNTFQRACEAVATSKLHRHCLILSKFVNSICVPLFQTRASIRR